MKFNIDDNLFDVTGVDQEAVPSILVVFRVRIPLIHHL